MFLNRSLTAPCLAPVARPNATGEPSSDRPISGQDRPAPRQDRPNGPKLAVRPIFNDTRPYPAGIRRRLAAGGFERPFGGKPGCRQTARYRRTASGRGYGHRDPLGTGSDEVTSPPDTGGCALSGTVIGQPETALSSPLVAQAARAGSTGVSKPVFESAAPTGPRSPGWSATRRPWPAGGLNSTRRSVANKQDSCPPSWSAPGSPAPSPIDSSWPCQVPPSTGCAAAEEAPWPTTRSTPSAPRCGT